MMDIMREVVPSEVLLNGFGNTSFNGMSEHGVVPLDDLGLQRGQNHDLVTTR